MFILESEVEHALRIDVTDDTRYLDRIIRLSEKVDRDNLLDIVKAFGSKLYTNNLNYTELSAKFDDFSAKILDSVADVIYSLDEKYDPTDQISVNEVIKLLEALSSDIETDNLLV